MELIDGGGLIEHGGWLPGEGVISYPFDQVLESVAIFLRI
jgi:hypothetical protein